MGDLQRVARFFSNKSIQIYVNRMARSNNKHAKSLSSGCSGQ